MHPIHLIYFLSLFLFTNEEECVVTTYEEVDAAVASCKDIVLDSLTVPSLKTLNLHLTEGTTVTFRGNTTFEYGYWTGPLVSLKGTNITVKGEKDSLLDGQGSLYWDGEGTHLDNNKPRFFRIGVTDALLEALHIKNCPVLCILIRSSNNLVVRNWSIDNYDGDEDVVPKNVSGHNTDGFNIEGSNNTLVQYCSIANQDDCVVVTTGINVTVHNVYCHGSHGLSIRGKSGISENISFYDSVLMTGENGIHIKTFTTGDPGIIRNVSYSNITIHETTKYGINIQQNYPDGLEPSNLVLIHDLQISNINGNVDYSAVPVFIMCAKDGCFDWYFDSVTISGNTPNNCTNYIPDGFEC